MKKLALLYKKITFEHASRVAEMERFYITFY